MAGHANQHAQDALAFAVRVHGGARNERKGTTFPYVVHPIRVAQILDQFGCDENVVAAGFLHDTIEDADTTADEIGAVFGPRVAALVVAVTEPDKSLPWRERKEHTIGELERQEDRGVLELIAADKLDNVRSIQETLSHAGEKETWARFKTGRPEQHWYYRRIVEILLKTDPGSRLFRTLDFETQALFPDARHATNLFAGRPLGNPHDARAYLADPIKHWRPGYSAYELAGAWIRGNSIPPRVAEVLASEPVYAECRFIEGLFEREVELGTPGRPSQTDLLVLVELASGYGVIAVEGKAREPFGPIVSDWNDTSGKQARLDDLCAQLGIDPSGVGDLRYQLLHRTVSALREAKRYGAREALMLVHSFDPADSSLDAYQAFAAAIGVTGAIPNAITSPAVLDSVTLRLSWVRDSRDGQPRQAPLVDSVLAAAWRRASPLHGEGHWHSVAATGLDLAVDERADIGIVFLFGLLHDTRRENEWTDPDHGPRAATFTRELQAAGVLTLEADRLELLCDAIERHADGKTSDDPTVGVCWDADRLHLPRVGHVVDSALLSTSAGRESGAVGKAASRRDDPIDWLGLLERL